MENILGGGAQTMLGWLFLVLIVLCLLYAVVEGGKQFLVFRRLFRNEHQPVQSLRASRREEAKERARLADIFGYREILHGARAKAKLRRTRKAERKARKHGRRT